MKEEYDKESIVEVLGWITCDLLGHTLLINILKTRGAKIDSVQWTRKEQKTTPSETILIIYQYKLATKMRQCNFTVPGH